MIQLAIAAAVASLCVATVVHQCLGPDADAMPARFATVLWIVGVATFLQTP